jgi:transcriptional regulator with XRE-family HTH domain
MPPFGAWLRKRREAQGVSQRELSEKSGVPQTTISHIALVKATGGTVADALGLEEGGQDAMTAELLSEWLSMPVAARRSLLEFIKVMRGGRDGRG